MKLILGSQSPRRQELLTQAGFEFKVIPADIDEKAIRTDDYELLPQLIASAKNDALAERITESAILITADTVTTYDGELREKPESAEQAKEFLRSYGHGIPSITISAIVVLNTVNGKQAAGFTKASLYFKPLDDAVITQIVTDGSIMGMAGAYGVQLPAFQPYIDRIEGDRDTIIGMSTKLVTQLIAEVSS